jgi:hypothetical protein
LATAGPGRNELFGLDDDRERRGFRARIAEQAIVAGKALGIVGQGDALGQYLGLGGRHWCGEREKRQERQHWQ